ncbi:MAG TPA: choice-of-anchor Q domain-containing protein, partial [Blastocatellia bacterium]|nr:choice-of-anchor Q domain-containing protein [Blastocatellia bacterium]
MRASQLNRFRITLALLILTLAVELLAPLSRAGRSESVEAPAQIRTTQKATLQPSDDSDFFNNFQSIPIPDSGPSSLYPSTINVSGLDGVISSVSLSLNNLTHPNPDDINVLLVSPSGRSLILMSDAGGSFALTNRNIFLDDEEAGAVPLPDNGQIVPRTYTTSNYDGGDADSFPAPAPAPPYGNPARFETLTTAFSGEVPTGAWSLFVFDDTPGNSGSFATGWSMMIETVTYEVTNLNDSGPGSLRQAIAGASPGDRIDIDPGLTGTITLTSGEILIDKNLTINGPGEDRLAISGNDASIVFIIEASFDVTFSNLTISNGKSLAEGGGIINRGNLTLTDVTVAECMALSSFGGGIYNTGSLTLQGATVRNCGSAAGGGGIANDDQGLLNVFRSTFLSNSTVGDGGAILNLSTSFLPQLVDRTTFEGNSASIRGGAVYSDSGAPGIRFTKSTFNRNSAENGGGIYLDSANVTATNCTFYDNVANPGDGGGLYSTAGSTLHLGNCTLTTNDALFGNGCGLFQEPGGTTTLKNVIAAQNETSLGSSGDIFAPPGSVTSQGGNLIGDGTDSNITPQTGDNFGTSGSPIDPKLTDLGFYGGDTKVRMPQPGSPAINTGVSPSNRNNEDQRGLFAPQGPAEDKGSGEFRIRNPSRVTLFDIGLYGPNEVHFFASLEEDSPAALALNDQFIEYFYQRALEEADVTRGLTNFSGRARGQFQLALADGQVQTIKAEFPGSVFHNASTASRTFKIDGLFRPAPGSSTPGGAGCQFLIFDADGSFAANGGSATINVRTFPQTCNWTAVSNDPWIQITSGASGTGDGSVSYTVSSHTGTAPRAGSITVAGITYTVLQGAAFTDVLESHPFYTFIGKLSARGVTLGCNTGNYCPDDVVTRQQMAAFIIRALGDFNPPEPAMQRFTDVPPANPFYRFIDQMAVRQITLGCTQTMYCPLDVVTRQQ